jgi:hypothetical protein
LQNADSFDVRGRSRLIPDYATHYHLGNKTPFLNLCDVAEVELPAIIADLAQRRVEAGLKRVFGPKYMALRRMTESRLRELFIERGGKPQRISPHYLCLGSCEWFRNLAPDMQELVVPLSTLPSELTSFTLPDSCEAMGFGPVFGLPYNPKPYHRSVFKLGELAEVVAAYGLPVGEPDADYDGYHRRTLEKFIEIQVWTDAPFEQFLPRAGGDSA